MVDSPTIFALTVMEGDLSVWLIWLSSLTTLRSVMVSTLTFPVSPATFSTVMRDSFTG